jgi:RNA polymerase sigma-70 factor (ECF subfamily)
MLGPAEADDVAQEVWLAVVRGLPRLRQPDRFAPWLFRIARRQVVNRLRAEYATPEVAGDTERAGPDTSDAVVDRADVEAGLAGLPAVEREVLILFYLQDLSLEACAEICAVPAGTVKSRLNRARRLLRDQLSGKGYGR